MQKRNDLIAHFIEQVISSPLNIAIQTSAKSITYKELYEDVLKLKELFKEHKLESVVVCLDRTPRLIATLLALQWLKITYIPIEPTIPLERLRTIIEDSDAAALIYDNSSIHDFTLLPCFLFNLHDNVLERKACTVHSSNSKSVSKNNVAYIIYTSGSTGKPKGVAISYKALNHFLYVMSEYFLNAKDEMLLAVTTITFDIATLELYLPLWKGKTVFLTNQKEHADPLCLAAIMDKYSITLMQATPSLFSMLKNINWHGRQNLIALCGGERLSESLAEYMLGKVKELWNMYGPTEATVWCALKKIVLNEAITVGTPISGMHMHVMDLHGKKLLPYVKGELFISGIGLAEGYVNNPKKTKAKFITMPGRKTRFFRTGDIACCNENGEFIIFGRRDNQVKLHGYRIELEEIEACINALEDVHECAVALLDDRLIAYICFNKEKEISKASLNQSLAIYLPNYMLPQDIMCLKQLPRTANGKIDRKNLPILQQNISVQNNDFTALTSTQMVLMNIWRDILHISNINIKDSFFDLGGHSLIAAQLESQIAQKFNKQILLSDFYQKPTIEYLSDLIENAPENSLLALNQKPQKALSWLPLTDFQFLFWGAMIVAPELQALNIVARRRIQGFLNKTTLDVALQLVYAKHEAFAYKVFHFIPLQKRIHKQCPKWQINFLKDCETIEERLNASFDELFHFTKWSKQKSSLIARCFYLADNSVELQICMPHFIADEMSLDVFFKDLSFAYLSCNNAENSSVNTVDTTYNYSAYALQQNEVFKRTSAEKIQFWRKYLQDASLFLPPKSHIVRNYKAFAYSTYLKIPEEFFIKLRAFCEQNSCTASEVLCAASAFALLSANATYFATDLQNILINIVRSTRTDLELADLIGCFLQNQLLKLNVQDKGSLLEFTKQVQEAILKTKDYQQVTSLVKMAAIGKLKNSKLTVKSCLRTLGFIALSSIAKWVNLNPALLDACRKISRFERGNNFFVNVNIFSSFFDSQYKINNQSLFNKKITNIPLYAYDKISVKDQIEICFLREDDTSPYLVISSNLTYEFKQQIGEKLLDSILLC